ncbi:GNAT family N-acetyltransferase [Sphingomonas crocodyli]|uniref:N-acetyltransferase n=1 Tax=Sphingomonas crocodyli TaxID=1979270 RepID=A0A437M6V3_9SPHN|nr:GNAT family N-acetyltransferase [Sphingomonas crocodyli]RVT93296.1 N-acetyltransferase [Sphingomonas crocodyli]
MGQNSPVDLTTRRLTLRPIGAADLFAIAALHADPRVAHQLVDGVPDDGLKALQFLRWNAPLRDAGIGTFAVRRHGEVDLIGLFSLTPFRDDPALLELGGKLAPSAWRGGLAVEAGAAMIDHAIGTLGRDRLVSAFHPDHRAVPFSLARLGFVDAGRDTLFGRDVRIMALDAADWRAQGRKPLPPRQARTNLTDYGRGDGIAA